MFHFFRNNFTAITGMPAEPFPGSSAIDVLPPLDPAVEPVEVPEVLSVEPAVEPTVDPGMPSDPASVEHDILAPAPFDHNLTHFPKLSTCDVCNRARLYSKRVKSRRVVNEELDLAEPEAFGQQLACDHLIFFKSSRGKEHAVLIVQDRFSKVFASLSNHFKRSIPTSIKPQAFRGFKIKLLYHCSFRRCRRNLESSHREQWVARELSSITFSTQLRPRA